MDSEKVLEVMGIYRDFFVKNGTKKKDFSHFDKPGNRTEILEHCHGMLDKMEQFVKEGRMDKAFRWLGFVQGCLWATGKYRLEDLKNHNRPK